jgi:hypothetical protein
MHRLAAKPIKARVEFAMDTPGIRDRGEAAGRRAFDRHVRESHMKSFSVDGVA